jgi:hypothetical protein
MRFVRGWLPPAESGGPPPRACAVDPTRAAVRQSTPFEVKLLWRDDQVMTSLGRFGKPIESYLLTH